jgi:hypothetical protein
MYLATVFSLDIQSVYSVQHSGLISNFKYNSFDRDHLWLGQQSDVVVMLWARLYCLFFNIAGEYGVLYNSTAVLLVQGERLSVQS